MTGPPTVQPVQASSGAEFKSTEDQEHTLHTLSLKRTPRPETAASKVAKSGGNIKPCLKTLYRAIASLASLAWPLKHAVSSCPSFASPILRLPSTDRQSLVSPYRIEWRTHGSSFDGVMLAQKRPAAWSSEDCWILHLSLIGAFDRHAGTLHMLGKVSVARVAKVGLGGFSWHTQPVHRVQPCTEGPHSTLGARRVHLEVNFVSIIVFRCATYPLADGRRLSRCVRGSA